jgi:hypothetical protein
MPQCRLLSLEESLCEDFSAGSWKSERLPIPIAGPVSYLLITRHCASPHYVNIRTWRDKDTMDIHYAFKKEIA